MSDVVDDYRAMKEHRKAQRREHGIECPRCKVVRPKAHPSILLPGQRCRVDTYLDPRPPLE